MELIIKTPVRAVIAPRRDRRWEATEFHISLFCYRLSLAVSRVNIPFDILGVMC